MTKKIQRFFTFATSLHYNNAIATTVYGGFVSQTIPRNLNICSDTTALRKCVGFLVVCATSEESVTSFEFKKETMYTRCTYFKTLVC